MGSWRTAAVAAQSCDERPARQSCRLQRRGRAARHRSSGAGTEAVSVPRRGRRLGVHGSAARRRAAVSRAAGRAAVREARGQAARALEPQRCGADRAEHLLRADSARFSARGDRERVGRYAAYGPHRAAAAQRDARSSSSARPSSTSICGSTPSSSTYRGSPAPSIGRLSRTGCRMRSRAPSVSRRRSPTRRRTRTRRASTPSTS